VFGALAAADAAAPSVQVRSVETSPGDPPATSPAPAAAPDPRLGDDPNFGPLADAAAYAAGHYGERREWEHPPAAPEEVAFLHGGWLPKRRRVRDALTRAGVGAARLARFDNCGGGGFVLVDFDAERVKLAVPFCRDRHCDVCGRRRGTVVQANLCDKIEGEKHLHVILTQRHDDAPLREQIDRLFRWFSKLRETSLWKNATDGGCYVLEVTLNLDTRQWHPHLHVIARGEFLNQWRLSEAWEKITGGSTNVRVRPVNNALAAADEVAKYVSKPLHPSVLADPERAAEFVQAIAGRRLINTFGTWRGWKLLDDPNTGSDARWVCWGSLIGTLAAAAAGDRRSRVILRLLEEQNKWLARPPPLFSSPLTSQPLHVALCAASN
jgi:hypothetical protein